MPARSLTNYGTFRAVTPNDGVDLPAPGVTDGIIAGTAGTMAVIGENDSSARTITVAAGFQYDIRAKRILATGTTSTGIVACYK
jgi:hypothetical protein